MCPSRYRASPASWYIYDDSGENTPPACGGLLRYLGHDDVRVLDGGWAAWRAAGFDIAQESRARSLSHSTTGRQV
nr:rhodanese-like domain-containing protein [Kyrpidia tusciae]